MLPKTLQRLLERDDRIEDIWDERDMDSGFWVYLKPGYINWIDEVHNIHEDTVREVMAKLRYIRECDCDQCLAGIGRSAD